MIFSAVNICYDPSHQPFASEGAVKIQNLNSERSALKIVRAVLRDNDIDPEDAVNYSIHRCHCSLKIKIEDNDEEEAFNPESTLDELEIKDGDSVFIRKIDDRVEENADGMEEEPSTLRRSSRKRQETDYNEDDYTGSLRSTVTSLSTSRKRRPTSTPPNAPAAVDKITSNLENLSPSAAAAARSISKLLGGDSWKTQAIGKLGLIQAKSQRYIQALLRLVKTSLEIPQLSKSDRSGLFNSAVVEALTRAYHQRIRNPKKHHGGNYLEILSFSDYEKANELLKGKIRQDGSWERGSLAHLNESAFSKPASRFPLSNSGLSGQLLGSARAICALWGNERWINQSPLPGLSPISLNSFRHHAILRQMAYLTRVKPGEATPGGLPPIVLRALREAIEDKQSKHKYPEGRPSYWSQAQALPLALEILKRDLKITETTSSGATSSRAQTSRKEDDEEAGYGRRVRRKLREGN